MSFLRLVTCSTSCKGIALALFSWVYFLLCPMVKSYSSTTSVCGASLCTHYHKGLCFWFSSDHDASQNSSCQSSMPFQF